MNTKGSLYAVIGGVVGAVLTLAVCSVMPIGAQNGDVTFGEITCTGLRVVDAVELSKIQLAYDENGGRIVVSNSKDGTVGVSMGINQEGGGGISVSSPERPVAAMISIGDDGGFVIVGPGVGEHGGVIMGVDKNGGLIHVEGKGSTAAVQVSINEHGGDVGVFGNGSDKTRVRMSVSEYGNGVVSTWDKNAYRLATLK